MISIELALDALLGSEKEALGKLLGEGGASACYAVREDIDEGALGYAEVVDAAVLEETAIFDGDDCLHHSRRDLADR